VKYSRRLWTLAAPPVNGLLTMFTASHCWTAPKSSTLTDRQIDQEQAMSGSGDVAGDQLRTIVERIEQIEDEIKELTEARKEIYLEAKDNGFDVKVLREVIKVRKQDQKEREEHETLLDIYLRVIMGPRRAAKAA
jgi:uncharacterized protein (UPF0335 family)